MASTRPASCGLNFASAPDLSSCLTTAQEAHYEFVCIPLVHPNFKREFISGKAKQRPGPFTRADMILHSSDWNTLIVARLSPYLNVDSMIPHVRENHEAIINQELSLASHLGVPAITFKLNGGIEKNMNLARIINDKMISASNVQIWLQVPLENPLKQAMSFRTDQETTFESPWEWWNGFRSICDFHKKLGVALIISHDIPDDDEEINRWLGEPVKCLVIPTTLFISNKKGYPVLGRAHQYLIQKFCSLSVQFLLTGANRYQSISFYYNYLDHLWKKGCQLSGPLERYGQGYEDYLQFPLQPLMDNLESGTYEVFEKDPVKYKEYQRAIHRAILFKSRSSIEIKPLVIMVVGAGRGPLVRATLNAADIAKVAVKVYAIEKNPNAIITLHALKDDIFGDRVTIVSSDMRVWEAPEKADILVSELLGSFGDNELSPECLDGAQKFLNDDGISIPEAYTSYIGPVQSSKIFNELKHCDDKNKHPLAHFETPYVVYLHNKYHIAQEQPLFTFKHPNRDPVINNSRYAKKNFQVKANSVLHGFVGYFDVILFDNIVLSIVPTTHSPGMLSWFPIFFPIREPIQVKAGEVIELHFWRNCSPKNVWYEWSINKPTYVGIHNPNGRSYTIGL
ncbi:protein arginine N-methyltransferase 5 [Chelonus insularis]|uniref:protein arginine N-methyltransferase 5 n=1 Tax=Chelonus insularis TaxID=460826 RepID=UPI00158E0FC5|nr:protein arginine N-methyltransferase 5 [Chelonus insularis]XP_034947447.1 protein arginine N-methyltransferase 5 [Chelonus insularis]